MDPNGHIYMDDESKIPTEDKARLEGYLRGRAESDAEKIEAMRERMEQIERERAHNRRYGELTEQ